MASSKGSKGLGKGLGALLGDISVSPSGEEQVTSLPLQKVEPNPLQPRKIFDEEELQALADSISQHGVIQPLTVRKGENGFYQIIAGERRWRASGKFPWWSLRPTIRRPWSWPSLKTCSGRT